MKIYISLLFFLLVQYTIAQEQQEDATAAEFEWIMDNYYSGQHSRALVQFNAFLKKHPKSPLYYRALFNTGHLYREIGDPKKAIKVFEKLIASNANDTDAYGGLMEQYTLYKHRSARNLAEIYLDSKVFDKAAKYIRLFDKKYKYQHFCGNELMANDIYTATMYARLYWGQEKKQRAIKTLLPYLFDSGLASNAEVLHLLEKYLNATFSTITLQKMVKEAYHSLEVKNNETAYFSFLDKRIPIYEYQLFQDTSDNSLETEKTITTKFEKVLESHPLFSPYLQ